MATGKIFTILGAIIVLISTYFLAFRQGISAIAYGTGFWMNVPLIFSGSADWYVYLMAIILMIFLLSGFFLLIGIKKRSIAIFGGFFALLGALYLFISMVFNIFSPAFEGYQYWFYNYPIIPGILPFDLPIGDVSLGLYTLLGGAVLGFIGALMPRE